MPHSKDELVPDGTLNRSFYKLIKRVGVNSDDRNDFLKDKLREDPVVAFEFGAIRVQYW